MPYRVQNRVAAWSRCGPPIGLAATGCVLGFLARHKALFQACDS
jgi:hypothetical protein